MGRKLRRLRVEGLKVSGLGKLTFKGFWGFRLGRVLGLGLGAQSSGILGLRGLRYQRLLGLGLRGLRFKVQGSGTQQDTWSLETWPRKLG